jgi:hypothetical protein
MEKADESGKQGLGLCFICYWVFILIILLTNLVELRKSITV